MPIYAYRCEACGHAKDVLQKMSDPVLTTCPSCGAESFKKQVTAAGFQLKGSGWYVTDFRSGSGAKAPAAAGDAGNTGEAKGAGAGEAAGSGTAASPASGSPAPPPSAGPSAGSTGGDGSGSSGDTAASGAGAAH